MTDYVITVCCNYPLKVYERFLGTLYDSGYKGNTVMFIFDKDLSTVNDLKAKYRKNVEFITFKYNCISFDFLNMLRYKLVYEYLKDKTEINRILFTDSRDVIFQRNFSNFSFTNEDLCLFREDLINSESECTLTWVKYFNSENAYGHKYAICGGTVIGKYKQFMEFLRIMLVELSIYILDTFKFHPNFDQALLNYCYYMDKFKDINIKLYTNIDNLVNTLGCAHKEVNENGRIVNENGEVSWICHQYDRFTNDMIISLNNNSIYDFT